MLNKKFGKYIVATLICAIAILAAGCSKANKNIEKQGEKKVESKQINTEKKPGDKNPLVTIEMDNGNKIKIELYPEIAPNTVRNFISLVNKGFYDGVIFHRVIPEFMIQGGDPEGVGTGGSGYAIKGEFSSNGYKNDLKHERGIISMARSSRPDSAGSQFFIMVKEAPHLDGEYAAFGKVIEGMEEVDRIVSVERDGKDKPIKEEKMKKVTVDTFGVEYNEPEKQ